MIELLVFACSVGRTAQKCGQDRVFPPARYAEVCVRLAVPSSFLQEFALRPA